MSDNAIRNKLFAKNGHVCEITSSWEDLYMFQGGSNLPTQIRHAWIRFRMASELNIRGNNCLKSQKALEEEHRNHLFHMHIIHPFSQFRKYWETFMTIIFAIVFVTIPLDLASFECPIEGHLNNNMLWKWMRLIFDLCCMSDVLVNFITGYYDTAGQHVVMDPKLIALRYFLTYFIPDLLSSIPTHMDVLFYRPQSIKGAARSTLMLFFQYTSCFKLTRYLTFYIYSKRLAEAYKIDYAAYRLTFALLMFISSIHILTCLNVAYIGMTMENVRKARIRNLPSAKLIEHNRTITFVTMYIRAFYETTHVTLASYVGFDVERIKHLSQRILIISTWFLSKVIFFYMISQIISVVSSWKSSNNKYREMLRQLREYMRYKQLPEHLQKRLISYYEFRYQKSYFRETEILDTVSGQLRQEIVLHGCRKLVENVEFFKNLPLPLIIRIVSAMRTDIYMVNDVVIKANTAPTCMFFIASGCVAVYTKGGQEVCHLEDGDYFGEISLVESDRLRTASVVAVETCELYRLEKYDFVQAILPYPDLVYKINKIANARLEQTEFVEERMVMQRQIIRNIQDRH